MLDKRPVPKRPTNLIIVGQGPMRLQKGEGHVRLQKVGVWVVWTLFVSSIISLLSPSLWEIARF